ncbi:Glycerol kinase [hydrothermal vent metagenome]|uniref:glycerol kinase n=1 Tax=hydrothermal vent metagenome TaxID=652676 RepID=A0A3B0TLL5_9ZZZZ
MKKEYILSIDQGTTGTRAILFNKKGKIVSSGYKEFKQYFPNPGWVEHDAVEIWKTCETVIKLALKKAHVLPNQIKAIGITNQRETTVLWDRKTSKPVARAIVWQCRRTADMCSSKRLYQKRNLFRQKTGLVLDPYFSGTKIKWLLDNVKGLKEKAKKGDICFGTIDSWLIWKLTGRKNHVTDMTNASRTLIFNIKTKQWDHQLLKILSIPSNILPKVQKSGSNFGITMKGIAGLESGIPITAVLGDQQAALYGQGCFKKGSVKNTYGTGCFIVLNTGKNIVYSKKGLLSTIASDEQGNPIYAMEGSVFIGGAVIQWLRDQLKIIKDSSQTEKKISHLKNTEGVYFVPAFTGLGAPFWDSQAKGAIVGLTRGSSANHIIRAALESIAYQTKDVFDLMQSELGIKIKELKVDGGASKNNFLMQFQADILNTNIVRPKIVESTAWGAALLAGVKIGFWNANKDFNKVVKKDRTFSPQMKKAMRDTLYLSWTKALQRVKS